MSVLEAADVQAAAERIEGVVHRTPVLRSRALDAMLGAQVALKAESFQRGGAFKLRGAYNKLASLAPQDLRDGVVASSSGNHAQAVAIAAGLLGARATIVMPHDALASKVQATRGYGAEIVPCDRAVEDLEERAVRLAAERGLPLVHPFDDPLVMAGQGTATLELLEQAGELDVLLVPIGGGGLISGGAVIARERAPSTRVIGVEPAGADDTHRSLATGERVRLASPASIADGQLVPCPGKLTFAVIQELVERVLLVEDAEILRAMRILFERLKLVVEPSGASALAAALAHREQFEGLRVGVIVSGGNIDVQRFAALMSQDA